MDKSTLTYDEWSLKVGELLKNKPHLTKRYTKKEYLSMYNNMETYTNAYRFTVLANK